MGISVLHKCVAAVQRVGPRGVAVILRQRLRTYLFAQQWRKKIKKKTQGHVWHQVARELGCTPVFERFFSQQRARRLNYLDEFFSKESECDAIKKADQFVARIFTVLGSPSVRLEALSWHEDIRLGAECPDADRWFDATSLYHDIPIVTGSTESLSKDIKVPWELSRLQHLVIFGRAYEMTKKEVYAQAFVEQVTHWRIANPFLQGINWISPMEVGLRAISLVIAATYFGYTTCIPESFWREYTCLLYDHLVYLEHNWELYDLRTSNHYFSNLVGYVFLCWFFNDTPHIISKKNWCIAALAQELEKQINTDGTHYEHSTGYHCFVLELVYHAHQVMKQLRSAIPSSVESALARMSSYLAWCSVDNTQVITLGDMDAGRVVYPGFSVHLLRRATEAIPQKGAVCHFPQGGLSVIKTDGLHVTLRHHVYHERELTSHRHNDAGSVTLAVNGHPMLVDPGTYVYTASRGWRNLFRSVSMHNTSFIEGIEPIPFEDDIFFLRVPPCSFEERASRGDVLSMGTVHNLYHEQGWRFERSVTVTTEGCTISDTWLPTTRATTETIFGWSFMLAPEVTVACLSPTAWKLEAPGASLVLTSNELRFSSIASWFSPSYGVKVPTTQLYATLSCAQSVTVQCRVALKS